MAFASETRRRRPTAFEISFPEEPFVPTPTLAKRKSDSSLHSSSGKRREVEGRIPERELYRAHRSHREVREEGNTILQGEVHVLYDEDDGDNQAKPVRVLNDFSIFASDSEELRSLADIRSGLVAAGFVSAYEPNEEDAGQEGDPDEEEMIRLRTTRIIEFDVNYTRVNDSMQVKTAHAHYFLGYPSSQYKTLHRSFMQKYRIVQLVVATALDPFTDDIFDMDDLKTRVAEDIIKGICTPEHIQETIPTLEDFIAATDHTIREKLSRSTLVNDIRRGRVGALSFAPRAGRLRPARRPLLDPLALPGMGSLDLRVLRPENQTSTFVSPLVAGLVTGWTRESLHVVGAPPKTPPHEVIRDKKQQARDLLMACVRVAKKDPSQRKVVWGPQTRYVSERERYEKKIMVDDIEYGVGDVVVLSPYDSTKRHEDRVPEEMPDSVTLPVYFRFAKILYIDRSTLTIHLQKIQHSTQTFLEKFGDPLELFLLPECSGDDSAPKPNLLCGKIPVTYIGTAEDVPRDFQDISTPYFIRSVYRSETAAFFDPFPLLPPVRFPEDLCPICVDLKMKDDEWDGYKIKGGVQFKQEEFHPGDYVLIESEVTPTSTEFGEPGLALIGQITYIKPSKSKGTWIFECCLYGRQPSLSAILPENEVQDERQLFRTKITLDVPLRLVLRHVYVLPMAIALRAEFGAGSLENWLAQSPDHFYAVWHFPTAVPEKWISRECLDPAQMDTCAPCMIKKIADIKKRRKCDEETPPLRVLDLCAGTGTFSVGMNETAPGRFVTTHAVEISPSAVKSLKAYSPNAIVYNQCMNEVYRYMVKKYDGHDFEDIPPDLDGLPLPIPPKPGDIDCLVAGFPCQPHSQLNRFQRAEDPKSNLIWNMLSWVDFLKPDYCYFENVRGFLNYNLNALQQTAHTVEGGEPMGGLRLVQAIMLKLGYQTKFFLLNAAHYGTPQTRVRWFMSAARHGLPLPHAPQPTHHFPFSDALAISLPYGPTVKPIVTKHGYCALPFVTVEDAIGDLPRHDWRVRKPKVTLDKEEIQEDLRTLRGPYVAAALHDRERAHVGFPEEPYFCDPQNAYQLRARKNPTANLQHYTRPQKEITVEQVCSIPLRKNADYRDIPRVLWSWQLFDPTSGVARHGFKGGVAFARIDKEYVFQTTVTNVEPTAKQSRVLHPWCKRMVTVRELARSQGFPDDYVFYAEGNNVKTMQRQIGNAVSWQVSAALGRELHEALYKRWSREHE